MWNEHRTILRAFRTSPGQFTFDLGPEAMPHPEGSPEDEQQLQRFKDDATRIVRFLDQLPSGTLDRVREQLDKYPRY